MKQIRHNMWETNSSSTHAICIHKRNVLDFPKYIYFGINNEELNYNEESMQSRANYLHTVMAQVMNKTNYVNTKAKIDEILHSYNVKTEWAKFQWEKDGYQTDVYCDVHEYCMDVIINKIIPNKDLLLHYLFDNNSTIIVGYDNDFNTNLEEHNRKHQAGEEYEYYAEY